MTHLDSFNKQKDIKVHGIQEQHVSYVYVCLYKAVNPMFNCLGIQKQSSYITLLLQEIRYAQKIFGPLQMTRDTNISERLRR